MKNAYKVLFIGIDAKVFDLLKTDSRVELVGTNVVLEFSAYRTNNPVDYFFKWSYYLHNQRKFSGLKILLFAIGRLFKSYSSDLYKQFYPYLSSIIWNNIHVVNLDDLNKLKDFVEKHRVDVFVLSNWWMLPEKIINIPKFKTVNIHPSPLPKYRGSVPTLWSLKNKDQETAVSFMVIDSSMDGGNLIAQHKVLIDSTDNAITLEEKCDAVIRENFVSNLIEYLDGKIILKSQDRTKASVTAKYFPYLKINWAKETAEEIVNKILLYPHLWPPDQCFCILQNSAISFKHAYVDKPTDLLTEYGHYTIDKDIIRIRAIDGVVVAKLEKDINHQDSIKLRKCETKKLE